MRASRFTKQIIAALRQAEGRTPVVQVCRKLDASEQRTLQVTVTAPNGTCDTPE